jgi:inner membrane protein
MAFIAGRERVPASLLAVGVIASILPDADVIGLRCGIPYGNMFGHRGFFHSLCFAFLSAIVGALAFRRLGVRSVNAFVFLFLSMASHGLLDAATNGGLGIALFSPFSNHRYFFPWHPIAVAPLSAARFFSSRFSLVMLSEIKWIWLPFISLGLIGLVVRRVCRHG